MTAPASFNIATAVEDFAGPGREIKRETREGFGEHGLDRHIWVTAGRWTFSATWNFGTYCSGARGGEFGGIAEPQDVATDSPDAEVAFWPTAGGDFIEVDGESVAGWIRPGAFVAALEAAERGDEAAIVSALSRRDGDES